MGTIKVIARDCGLSRSEMKYLSNRFNCWQKKSGWYHPLPRNNLHNVEVIAFFIVLLFYINFYAITNTIPLYRRIIMQSSTRNHYDIVTEGIISTIPEKFRLQSYVKHYPQTNFPKLPSNFNISRNIINLLLITSDRMNYIILRNPQLFSVLSKLLFNHQLVITTTLWPGEYLHNPCKISSAKLRQTLSTNEFSQTSFKF